MNNKAALRAAFSFVSPRATCTCWQPPHGIIVVIPEKAGIQGVNGIARLARDSKNLIAGGSAPAPWVPFFARAKKGTKESTFPGWRTIILASAALGPALTRRDILSREPAAGILPAALRALAQSLAGLGCAIRGWKTPPSDGLSWVVDLPVVASRAPSKAEGSREPFERAQGAKMYDKTSERSEQGYIFAPGELGERPAVARRAGYRAKLAR